MSINHELARVLSPGTQKTPAPQSPSDLRFTRGVVQSVNTDGTLMVQIDGSATPVQCDCYSHVDAAAGDTVELHTWGGRRVVDGVIGLTRWDSYTPTWTTGGTGASPPSVGNGTLLGRYRKVGKTCHVQIRFVAPASWTGSGGKGYFIWGLPFPAGFMFGEDDFLVKYGNNQFALNLIGFAYATPGGSSVIAYLPARTGADVSYDLQPMQNTDSGGLASASIPYCGGGVGAYAIPNNGGNVFIDGSYDLV